MNILCVGAHPDDLDFGVSGTMIKMAREGHKVYYLICTTGDKGGTRNEASPEELVKIRRKEQETAGKIIGLEGIFFLNHHDGELMPDQGLREEIVRVIRQVRPDRVYSFDPANLSFDGFHLFHSDHRAVAISVFDAIYPAAKNRLYFPHLTDEGLQPHRVDELFMFGTNRPDTWSDITGVMEDKIRILQCHRSQFNGEPAEQMIQYLKERSRQTATGQDFEYAEAFRHIAFPPSR